MAGVVEVLGGGGRGFCQLLVLDLRRVAVAPPDVQPPVLGQNLAQVQLGAQVHRATRRPAPGLGLRLHLLVSFLSVKNYSGSKS